MPLDSSVPGSAAIFWIAVFAVVAIIGYVYRDNLVALLRSASTRRPGHTYSRLKREA
jgi:hypothetical protein